MPQRSKLMSKFRMPHINQLAVSGRIDGAPCQREGFVEVRIACQKSHRNAQGAWVEETSYITARVRGKVAQSIVGLGDATYPGPLSEGLPVFATGRVRSLPDDPDRLIMEVRNIEVLKNRETDDEPEPGEEAA